LDIPFEHRSWSVGKDLDRIRDYNPLGRVPALLLDTGESLIDSAAILDYLDDLVGASRALVPARGEQRRATLRLMALAVGAAEKGAQQVYERVFRPADKRHQPWLDRLALQTLGALAELERCCAQRPGRWLIMDQMTQADITVACAVTFLDAAVATATSAASHPALRTLVERCELRAEFAATRMAWTAPVGAE